MEDKMKYWKALKQPPKTALKPIQGGRLKGKTDINPQWRYQAMTEQFGPCGVGWKYTIEKLWLEPVGSEVCAFAQVGVSIKVDGEWSEPIPGIGGSMLLEQETKGLHVSDEAYKMATTDALSVALKMIGVAADIYAGLFDGSKYQTDSKPPTQKTQTKTTTQSTTKKAPPLKNAGELLARAAKFGLSTRDVCEAAGVGKREDITDFDAAWVLTAKKFASTIKSAQETPAPEPKPEPAPEPEPESKPEPTEDVAWIKASLPKIKWPEKTAASWLTSQFGVKGGLLDDIIAELTDDQMATFIKEIKDRMEMA